MQCATSRHERSARRSTTMKKLLYIGTAIVVLLIGGIAWYAMQPKHESIAPPAITSFQACADAGYPIMESHPRQCRTHEGATFVEDIGNELEKQDLIRVSSPRPNTSIQSPLRVEGEARGVWFFEASFPVKIFDDHGFFLGIMPATAQGEWMTENFVPFLADIPFAVPSTPTGVVIFEKDNPSGFPEHDDALRMPVAFANGPHAGVGQMPMKIFLSDSSRVDDPAFDCSATVEVERSVPSTPDEPRAAMEALLRGPTDEERARGIASSLPPGVRLRSIMIANRTARVDLTSQLEYQMGGSCRVAVVRAQITDTLKQFSEKIDNVTISVDGRTEDILQP